MKTQIIISELKQLLNMPQVANGFPSRTERAVWANEVSALLKPCKEHHAHFMDEYYSFGKMWLPSEQKDEIFKRMVSIAKQGLYELEYNMPSEIEIDTPQKLEKEWYEKPLGLILLAVVSGLIVVYVAYYFRWNGSKEKKQKTQEQQQSATPSSDIPKKTPSVPPMMKK